jgi:hypothetical protein
MDTMPPDSTKLGGPARIPIAMRRVNISATEYRSSLPSRS